MTAPTQQLYVSYPGQPRDFAARAEQIVNRFRDEGFRVWWDRDLQLGDDIVSISQTALDASFVLLVVVGPEVRPGQMAEIDAAQALGKRIVPIVTSPDDLAPSGLERFQALLVTPESDSWLDGLVSQIRALAEREQPRQPSHDPEDPQKGRWGGRPEQHNRSLRAIVRPTPSSQDWFDISLAVTGAAAYPLTQDVVFFLHPTFEPAVRTVTPVNGVARLDLQGWGAFTVGATTDAGRVQLELDLSQDPTIPQRFRDR